MLLPLNAPAVGTRKQHQTSSSCHACLLRLQGYWAKPPHKMVALEAEDLKARVTSAPAPLGSSPSKKKRGPAEELTCAGIVIDPDVARMADAHEGARGVNAHGVLPAVVLPFGALINIWKEGRERERGGRGGTKAGWDMDCCHISIIWICECKVPVLFSDFNPSHSKVSIGSVMSWPLIDLHIQVRRIFVRRLQTPSCADQTILFISILHWSLMPHASSSSLLINLDALLIFQTSLAEWHSHATASSTEF